MLKAMMFILLAAAAGFSVSAQTRTRRAAAPPVIKNDAPQKSEKHEPVLNDARPGAKQDAETPTSAIAVEDGVVRVETDLVTTPVSVLDRNGRFLPNLRKKDFKIFENGVPQKITYFQSSEQPFTVVLMIDTSPSTRYHIDEIHYAAVTFVNQLRPQDKVMVIAFDQRLKVLAEPTSERQKLYAAIYKAQFGSGTSLYDAVGFVADLELLNVTGRKAVVLFTDGVDTTSRRASYDSTIANVEEIDALFYPIRYNTLRDPNAMVQAAASAAGIALPQAMIDQLTRSAAVRFGRGQSPAEYAKGRAYLETLAAGSGGRMFEADTITNLEASFAGIAEELRRQYSIGYYPESPGAPGERRKIKIQVARPKAVVRAKSSYIIKEDRGAASAEPGAQAAK